jgi:hypothetical protein
MRRNTGWARTLWQPTSYHLGTVAVYGVND